MANQLKTEPGMIASNATTMTCGWMGIFISRTGSVLTGKGEEMEMNEKDLIGKTIEKINIDGYGVEIRFTDGTEFVYNASDAGYSGWDISKSGEVA